MAYYDHGEQHIAAAVSAAVSSVANGSIFGRSMSAPHLHLANMPHDVYVPCRAPLPSTSHDQALPNHMSTPYNACLQEPLQHFSFNHLAAPSVPYTACPPPPPQSFNSSHTGPNDHHVAYQHHSPIHPFQQTEQFSSSINNLEAATETKVKFEYQDDALHPLSITQSLEDVKISDMPLSTSVSSHHGANPSFDPCSMPYRVPVRSGSMFNPSFARFQVPNEYPAYLFPRHGSLGSLYPITQHELMDPIQSPCSGPMESVPMHATASSTSITSVASASSMASMASNTSSSSSSSCVSESSASAKARARRASFNPDVSSRVFTCNLDECGKLFKRSEHLKRHVRSVHTLEKPFICPIDSCPKRFSRSDNLNQHIRIHRHDKEKVSKSFSFTPLNPAVGVVQS